MKNDVGVEAVDGATGGGDDAGGSSSADGEVGSMGRPVGFDRCQGTVKVTRGRERAADSVNVPEVDWRECEITREWGSAEIIGSERTKAASGLDTTSRLCVLHVEFVGDSLALS